MHVRLTSPLKLDFPATERLAKVSSPPHLEGLEVTLQLTAVMTVPG
jgi:hypothetical protein